MNTKDLDAAVTLLEYDVAQHVQLLAAARAQLLDTAALDVLTQRVIAATQALALSAAPQAPETAQAPQEAPEAPPVPSFLVQSALG